MKIISLFFISIAIPSLLFGLELRSGDVLLMSYNCYECRIIESETNSSYSHSGVMVRNEKNELMVAQAIGFTNLYTLEKFLAKKTPGTLIDVYRPQKFLKISDQGQKELDANMLRIFDKKFKNTPFDALYLWNNFDSQGRELLYCSEFVAKFMDHFLDEVTIPTPISYDKNRDYWEKYFKGNVPDNVLGNSPASFSTDPRYQFIGSF